MPDHHGEQAARLTDRIRFINRRAGHPGLARTAGVTAETVRRYLSGTAPSAAFLQRLCESYGVSGDWLLRGEGPVLAKDVATHALRGASGIALVLAIGAALDDLQERVERVEMFARRLAELESAATAPGRGPAERGPLRAVRIPRPAACEPSAGSPGSPVGPAPAASRRPG